MRTRSARRRVGAVALSAGAVALLATTAACGSSSSSSGGSSSDPNATTSVTIGIATPVAAFYLPYLAQEKGYFTAHHINATIKVLTPGVLQPALASGSIPYAVFASPQIEAVHETQSSVSWLGVWETQANIGMIAAPGIKTVADLKGHKVGVTIPGSEATVLTDTALDSVGLKPSDVKELQLSSSASELAAFLSGQIDAFVASQPLQSQALDGRKGSTVVDPFDQPWIGAGLAGNTSYAKSHAAATTNVLSALNDALTDWKSSKTDAEAAIKAAAPTTPQASMDLAYAATSKYFLDQLVAPDQAVETSVLASMKKFGYPKADPSQWQDAVDGSYLPSGSSAAASTSASTSTGS